MKDFLDRDVVKKSGVPYLSVEQIMSLVPLAKARRIQKYAVQVANTMAVEQTCLKGVRTALEGSGLVPADFFEGLDDAYQTIERFQKSNKFIEIDCDTDNLDMLPPGAVVVWDHGENGDAPSGHISISKGDGLEISDHICPQNTTGDRPKRNEKYGKKHVFLYDGGFEYVPGLTNSLVERNDTRAKKLRTLHTTLLLSSMMAGKPITDESGVVKYDYINSSMHRIVELVNAYKLDINQNKDDKDLIAEKKSFIKVVERLTNLNKTDEGSVLSEERAMQQLFTDLFDSFGYENQADMDRVLLKYANKDYLDQLKQTYNNFGKKKDTVRAYKGEDGQVYIYEIPAQSDIASFRYNSRGNEDIGFCATVVQMLYRIKDNAEMDAEHKDANLGNEIISVFAKYDVDVVKDLTKLYKRSLEIDKTSSKDEKEKFSNTITKQIKLYKLRQNVYKTKGRFVNFIKAKLHIKSKTNKQNIQIPQQGNEM